MLVLFAFRFILIAFVTCTAWYKSSFSYHSKITLSPISLKQKYFAPNPKSFMMGITRGLNNGKTNLRASVGGMPPNSDKPSKSVVISLSTSSDVAQELILQNFNQIQGQSQGKIGIIGTSELDPNQQQMIELLAYALVLSGNHVFTSGGGNGTNIAVIRGALRACNPDLLTVMLPQSLYKQPAEMQALLSRVTNLIEQPENDGLGLREAAQLCNYKLLSMVDKVIVFVYHDS